jgi:hypothetical protein
MRSDDTRAGRAEHTDESSQLRVSGTVPPSSPQISIGPRIPNLTLPYSPLACPLVRGDHRRDIFGKPASDPVTVASR